MYKYFRRTSDSSIYITEYYCQIEGFMYLCSDYKIDKYSNGEYLVKCRYTHIEEKIEKWMNNKEFPFGLDNLPPYVEYDMIAEMFRTSNEVF